MSSQPRYFVLFCLLLLISFMSLGCKHASATPTLAPIDTEQVVKVTLPSTTPSIIITSTPTVIAEVPAVTETVSLPSNWQDLPIVPTLSAKAKEIYQYGLTLGNDPHRFTKIGDGEISANWFLKPYDLGPNYYNLGSFTDLNQTIEYFAGSYSHQSQVAKRGYNTTKILDPKQADKSVCLQGETPLDCEIRIYKPSFALISMGTNQVWQSENYEQGLRIILDTLIRNGVVPILSTKADNLEGDFRINIIITNLAAEYELPVWNFWKICQGLPHKGLQPDLEHLTYISSNDFTDPKAMAYAWPNRNLTALQVLNSIYLEVTR